MRRAVAMDVSCSSPPASRRTVPSRSIRTWHSTRPRIERGASVAHDLAPGRHAWLQVVEGDVEVAGNTLHAATASR